MHETSRAHNLNPIWDICFASFTRIESRSRRTSISTSRWPSDKVLSECWKVRRYIWSISGLNACMHFVRLGDIYTRTSHYHKKVHCLLWWFLSFNFRNKYWLHRHRYRQCLRRFNHSPNRSISRCTLIYLSHTITVHNSTSHVIVFSFSHTSWLCAQQDAEIKRQNEKIAQLQGDQIRKEEEFKNTENALRNHYEKEIRSKEVLHVCSYSEMMDRIHAYLLLDFRISSCPSEGW